MANREQSKPSDLSADKAELLALLLEEEGLAVDKAPVISPRQSGEAAPVSFAQQRLWFLDHLIGGSTYNVPLMVRLEGSLNVEALKASLDEIIRRHETLRTTFEADGNGKTPVQLIAEDRPLEMPLIDLSGQPEAKRDAEAQQLIGEIARRRFDLATGPLLYAAVIRLSEEEHIFALSMHHIVSDAWSMGILTRELTVLYGAFRKGEPSPLSELPIQYVDFAEWQRNWLRGEVLEKQLSYWRKQLEGAPRLRLPTDRPRPDVQTYSGASQSLRLPPTLTQALNDLSRDEGATLFMTLLAAFNALLCRHTAQEDIVVGTPIANRNRVEIEGLIGFFVNTLAMRTDLSGNPTFRDLIGRVQRVTLDAYGHQDVPFEKLVDELSPERNLSYTPLFQVTFNMVKVGDLAVEFHGLSAEPVSSVEPDSKFDLTFHVLEGTSGIELRLVYNTDLFDGWRIAEFLKQYQTLLESIVANADQCVGELPLMPAEERQNIIDMGCGPDRPCPDDQSIHEVFARQVAASPDALALSFEEQTLTYQDLDTRANRLARYLQRHGVGPAARVGLCLERSNEMVVALLGVFKAGGAYVPLDPDFPQERLASMAADADVRLVLTEEKFEENLSALDVERIHLDIDRPAIDREQDSAPVCQVHGDSLAYVIFTSGSTGRPKGVEVEHRQVLNYVAGLLEQLQLAESPSFAMVSPLTADLGYTMLYPALTTGGTLHIVSDDTARDSVALGACFRRYRPDCLKIVPSQLASLLMGRAPADILPEQCLIVGGEACSWDLVDKVRALKPDLRVMNHYGPTETTVGVTTHHVDATDQTSIRPSSVPIGRPLPNSQVFILDSLGNPLPPGVAGELYIGGRGLARGYAGAPELTAERFVPHPFSKDAGARLYRTGDRARFRADGIIEFLGRVDHQVKLRGFRIELGEIENALVHQKGVRAGAAVIHEQEGREKQLVAYVVPGDGPLASSDLRQALQRTLPDYMVPTAFVMLDALPLTPNGKVDRRSLPAPADARPESEAAFELPRAGAEQTLAEVWKRLLRLDQVGRHDSFFGLGGDSILAIQMVARASQAGLRVTPKQIFQYQTIAELAKVVGVYEEVIAEQGVVTGPVNLTPIQHWFVERDFLEPHHWNMAWVFGADLPIRPEDMSQIVEALVEHHDALRLRLRQTEGGWRQEIVAPGGDAPFAFFDWSELSAAEAEQAWAREAGRLQASLSLSDGPLLRVALARFGSDQPDRLLLAIHHLAVDGVSLRILFEDLDTALEQLQAGKPIRLPPKTTSFRQWSERLLDYARSGALEQEVSYWREVVNTPCATLPRDLPDGENTVASTGAVVVALTREETQALLQQVPDVYHTQINDVLLTALAEAMTSWAGQENLLIHLEGHGREDLFEGVDLSRTVGWFTSKFPVVLARGSSQHSGERLKAVKEHLRQIPNRGIGYGVLRYMTPDTELLAEADDWAHPEVTFNYLGQFDQTSDGSELLTLSTAPAGSMQSPRSHRSSLVEIIGSVNSGILELKWLYSENIHERATMEALANSYVAALRVLIQHCLSPEAGGYTPSDFPLAEINQHQLDQIVTRLPTEDGQPRVSDLYPLTPLQQGLWFHELVAPESRVYFRHRVFRLDGDMDPAEIRDIWQGVLASHAIFRTSILWEGLDDPLQLVHGAATVPWEEYDWRRNGSDWDRAQLDAFLEADLVRGLDLTQPPLTRLSQIRVAESSWLIVWSYHHLILDRWSAEVVVNEVLGACAASSRGQPAPSVRPRPFRDYVAWLQRQEVGRAEDYWRGTLKGFTTPTVLGVDLNPARAEHEASQYGAEWAALSEASTRSLRQWARQHQLTLNTLFQGAWAILLSRYSESNDIVFGATVSGRSADLSGIESMVGLFINTLPVRAVVTADQPVATWLTGLQDQQVASRQYEHSPLFEIQKWSEVPSGGALFNTLVVFENTPGAGEELPVASEVGVKLQPLDLGSGGETTYPLTLVGLPGSALNLLVTYDTEHYTESAIQRLLGHFRRILEAMVSVPEQTLGDIPVLTVPERQQMLVEWNDTRQAFSEDAGVHELFAAQVRRTPDTVAVVFGGEQLSYRELETRANQLAHYLQRLGVGPDVLVGLCVNRSLELVIGVLGILKAGGGYVPLDPTYPAERLCFMLEETHADIVVTQSALKANVPSTAAHVLCLDGDEETLAREPTGTPVTGVSGENLAYVIFTSGSTGKPKGVALCHRTLTNLMEWQAKVQHGPSVGATLQFASLSFDVSCQEIFSTLGTGGRLVMIPEATRSDFGQLLDVLERERVERLFLPFVALQHLANSAEEFGRSLPALREVITAGEQLVISDSIVRLMNQRPERVLVNQYGPSESHVVTSYALAENPKDWPALPPIGRPIDNTQMFVLDAQLQPVPIGVVGDLYIGGTGLARGYANRPGLTAEKFVPDPFSAEPGARLYQTGDKARYQADGQIEFLGRTDHQVKLRGFRIELGEIESVLADHQQVRACVAMVREDEPGDKRLVGYVVPEGASVTVGELRPYLQDRLPDYMVPAHFVMLDTLPLTPSGKVDRRALPAPDGARPNLESVYEAPRGPIQETLAEIWRDVLGLEQVGVLDNFFDLGGHSLLATKIVSRLKSMFSIDISLRAFLDTPTIAGVSAVLDAARRGEAPTGRLGITPVARDRALPLSYAQERFWLLDQIHTERSVFNTPYSYRMRGPLRLQVLRQSVQALVDRHEPLRTSFPSVDGKPQQVIAASLSVDVPLQDCSGLSEEEQARMMDQALSEEQHFEFDLASGPLFRARLLRLAEDDHVLVFNLHHTVHDAWSLEVIIKDLVAAYSAGCRGTDVALPDLPIQYVDYAHWQRELLEGSAGTEQMTFWKNQLAQLPPALPLPTDFRRPAVQTFRGVHVRAKVAPELITRLRTVNRQEGTTLFMVFLATLQFLLHRLSGTHDIPVGAPVAGRNEEETHGLMGCFLNTLALRTDLSGDLTGRDLLQRVREVVLSAYENQDIPFEKILAEVQPVRDPSRTPVFQVFVNMHSFEDLTFPLSDLSVTRLPPVEKKSLFDMTLYFQETVDEIWMTLAYKADLFGPERMKTFMLQFQRVLEQLVDDPDKPLEAYSLLTEAARSKIPDPGIALSAPRQPRVVELIAGRALESPDHPAIRQGSQQWSYGELVACGEKLGCLLAEGGLRAGTVVALYGRPSFGLVVGMLGVLQCGGVLLMVDPALPDARKSLMLNETNARVLLLLRDDETDISWAQSEALARIDLSPETGDIESADMALLSSNQFEPMSTAGDPAYIFFTSGTTGKPKGIIGSHQSLSHFLTWQRDTFAMTPADRAAQLTGLSFDVVLRDIFLPLISGAVLCLPEEADRLDGERLLQWLDRERITVLHSVPAVATAWLASVPEGVSLSDLRWVFFAGEPLTEQLVRKWRSAFPGNGGLINLYGPTETTLAKCFYQVPEEPLHGVQPIGGPLPDTQVLIMNRVHRLCGIGELGEIVIRTAFRTLGTVAAEGAGGTFFQENPYRPGTQEDLYFTGDLGRYRPDGTVDILGRLDDQVKIRGVRIEPNEVMSALASHPAVDSCFVMARADAADAPVLVAYVIPAADASPSASELRTHLAGRLPAAMVPSGFVLMEAFPYTPNGKIDRQALPAPEEAAAQQGVEFVAPQTPTEKELAKIWQEVLGLERIGIADNFFEIGGHSLLATQVISRVRSHFEVELPLIRLFETPTIVGLTELIETIRLTDRGTRSHTATATSGREAGEL